MNKEERISFDEWWDKNEYQYTGDSLHMSEYHMAGIVWDAAIESYKNRIKNEAEKMPSM